MTATVQLPAAASARLLMPGDLAPWFSAPSRLNDRFDFSLAAGRYVVLCFLGSAGRGLGGELFAALMKRVAVFRERDRYFFGVTSDPLDRSRAQVMAALPGTEIFFDLAGEVRTKYGVQLGDAGSAPEIMGGPVSYILDPALRVLARIRDLPAAAHATAIVGFLEKLGRLEDEAPAHPQAPVLVVPNVFERALCRRLIDGYRENGGQESGFMQDRGGKTVAVIDHRHKRRSDWSIEDQDLCAAARARIQRRLVPQIARAFQFNVTRMERYIVACYEAQTGGHFRPHRDNTTKGTAHRRFAVTINLNAEEYEGGDLMFPEFGRRTYRAPTGGAVVFSCSLLHEALPVRAGSRFVFLPFLYDEEAARLREKNNANLGSGITPYSMAAASERVWN
jgi:peroxiredoxin/predicted 2-oxoglutarate/Fe(II)-dependent dioxygenase YbiX